MDMKSVGVLPQVATTTAAAAANGIPAQPLVEANRVAPSSGELEGVGSAECSHESTAGHHGSGMATTAALSADSTATPQPVDGLSSVGAPPPFVTKTYEMVDDPDTNSIVAWSHGNNSFVVWNPPEFARDLLPKYFKHSNFSSFVRQLNTYGFRKVDPDRWEFASEGFLRGQKHLLKNIHRRKPLTQSHQNIQHQNQGQIPASVGACVEVGKFGLEGEIERLKRDKNVLMLELVRLRQQQQQAERELQMTNNRLGAVEQRQQQMMTFLAKAMQNPGFMAQFVQQNDKGQRIAVRKKRRLPKQDVEMNGNRESNVSRQLIKYEPKQLKNAQAVLLKLLKGLTQVPSDLSSEEAPADSPAEMVDAFVKDRDAKKNGTPSAHARTSAVTLTEVVQGQALFPPTMQTPAVKDEPVGAAIGMGSPALSPMAATAPCGSLLDADGTGMASQYGVRLQSTGSDTGPIGGDPRMDAQVAGNGALLLHMKAGVSVPQKSSNGDAPGSVHTAGLGHLGGDSVDAGRMETGVPQLTPARDDGDAPMSDGGLDLAIAREDGVETATIPGSLNDVAFWEHVWSTEPSTGAEERHGMEGFAMDASLTVVAEGGGARQGEGANTQCSEAVAMEGQRNLHHGLVPGSQSAWWLGTHGDPSLQEQRPAVNGCGVLDSSSLSDKMS